MNKLLKILKYYIDKIIVNVKFYTFRDNAKFKTGADVDLLSLELRRCANLFPARDIDFEKFKTDADIANHDLNKGFGTLSQFEYFKSIGYTDFLPATSSCVIAKPTKEKPEND
jgi:hypothetical protein